MKRKKFLREKTIQNIVRLSPQKYSIKEVGRVSDVNNMASQTSVE